MSNRTKYLGAINATARVHYDLVSEEYGRSDRMASPPTGGFAQKLEDLCRRLNPQNIMELGVGSGRYFPYIGGGRLFVGIDISSGMLRQAQSKEHILVSSGFRKVELIQGDLLEARNLSSESFNLVYSIGVLGYHLPLNRDVMNVVVSLLAPGGCFFVTTVQQPPGMRVRKLAKHALMKLGFPLGDMLGMFSCSPSKYSTLANQARLRLVETLIFSNEALWNGLPQCGGVFYDTRTYSK